MQSLFLSSKQHMLASFNPACLLTLGDLLAFGRSLMQSSKPDRSNAPDAEDSGHRRRSKRPMVPDMQLQMGLSKKLTERKPQRYQVQNQTGMALWYWAEMSIQPSGPSAPSWRYSHKLKPNSSEHMKYGASPLSCVA